MKIDRNIMPRLVLMALLTAFTSTGCAKDILTFRSTTTEEFTQNARPEIDILWVVDNSNSMATNQAGIGQSFQAFIEELVAQGIDYHIGVVSTDTADGGRLHVGANGSAVITRDTPNPENAFLENVSVGVSGSAVEKAFESAALALGVGEGWNPGDAPNPPNPDFIRPQASLFIIMVSDEDDESFGPVDYYRKLFESYKGAGNEQLISVSAIAGEEMEDLNDNGTIDSDEPGYCPGSSVQSGARYSELAGKTGGIFANICQDFSQTQQELGLNASGLKSRFPLKSIPNTQAFLSCALGESAPFCVTVESLDGERLAINPSPSANARTGYRYDADRNEIVFGFDDIPAPQAKIYIEYQEGY